MKRVADLPIEAIKDAFVQAMSSPGPIVVSAPTGSGKSTRLPAWLLECSSHRVWVVEPRRVACRALAQWVASGLGESLGDTVGYRVRFDDRTSEQSRAIFVTPGIALNLWAAGEIGVDDVVVVDEFHERSWEVDLFTALVRSHNCAPHLVVCSATLDVEALRDRLGAVVLESAGRTFEVSVEYRGPSMPESDGLEERVSQAVSIAAARGPATCSCSSPENQRSVGVRTRCRGWRVTSSPCTAGSSRGRSPKRSRPRASARSTSPPMSRRRR